MNAPAAPLFTWATGASEMLTGGKIKSPQLERYFELLSASRRVALKLLSSQTHLTCKDTTSFQYRFRFVRHDTKLVTRNKQYLLNYPVTKYFTRGCLRFTRVGFKLEDDGIFLLGDLVKMTEDEFRSYTTSETIVSHVKQGLGQIGLDFGMSTPQWERPDPQSVSLG